MSWTVDLAGQRALVTGGGRGIGRAVARALSQAGAHVTVLSRTRSQLEQVVEELRAAGGSADWVVADVGDRAAVRAAVQEVLQRRGGLEIVVNAAGINLRAPALGYPDSGWDDILAVNLTGAFAVCQAAGAYLTSAGYGRVINITSLLAHVATHNLAAYGASKGGLAMLTRVLAVEWGAYGVTVNAVTPGYIETPLTAEVFADAAFRERVLPRTPLGRFGKPEEVAAAVVFLASREAGFITGQILAVDGGFLAGDASIRPWGGRGKQGTDREG